MSIMVFLIALHRSALLLYYFPPSYNFIFIIDHRFSIRFRSGLHGGHSIIFSPVNLLCSKNSWVSLDTWEREFWGINTHFTWNYEVRIFTLGKSFIHEMAIVSNVQFNSFINNGWSTIPAHIIILLSFCCLLLTTGMSELDKINHLVNQSGRSNVRDSSIKITFKKSIFMYFYVHFNTLEYLP